MDRLPIVCPIEGCKEEIIESVTATAGYQEPAEVTYTCPAHGIVGLWAYGFFDRQLPYHE